MSRQKPVYVKPAYKNAAEQACLDALHNRGLLAMKRGWPDFFVWHPHGGLAVVEVKRNGSHKLKVCQRHILEILASYGIACYRWAPDTGFRRIYPSPSRPAYTPIFLEDGESS